MDVDFQKSSKEDQMEVMMMNMMMQMDCNLPAEFNANFSDDIPELSSTILHHHNFSLDPFLNNHNLTSPTSFNPSFLETSSIQEPSTNTPPFPLNSRTGNRVIRTINGSELSNSTHTRSGISPSSSNNNKHNSVTSMRDMIFRIAAMQPIHIDPDSVKPPKRRNVKISKDPQSVAARHRRERISERIRILQRLVPGGTKMDTASMLDEAIHYVKFLKNQVQSLEQAAVNRPVGLGFSTIRSDISNSDYSNASSLGKCYQQPVQMFSSTEMNA